MTRGDLEANYKVRIVHSVRLPRQQGWRKVSAVLGTSMDGVVKPEEWISVLNRFEERLNVLVTQIGLTGECAKAREDLEQLRRGLDVPVGHWRGVRQNKRFVEHYRFGSKCIRNECPCVLEATGACPRKDGTDDAAGPHILIVDDDWPGVDPGNDSLDARAVWHQRVESFREIVRSLAFAILFDALTGGEAEGRAEEVTEEFFSDLADGTAILAARTLSNARAFWRYCIRHTIELCDVYTNHAAWEDLRPARVVSVMEEMQRQMRRQEQLREHRFTSPLVIKFTRPESELALSMLTTAAPFDDCRNGMDGK